MAQNTESDVTYCSDIEKDGENTNLIRRSKRLSQRSFQHSFRSNGGDAVTQRLIEICQMLKVKRACSNWLTDEWQSLKLEVNSIKNTFKGKYKSRITFILKTINKNLENLSCAEKTKSPGVIHLHENNDEQINSPNILAGMMEASTEVPPYQPRNSSKIIENSELDIIALTQKNPLDLSKIHAGPSVTREKKTSHDEASERLIHRRDTTTTTTTEAKTPQRSIKASTIDLTEEIFDDNNQENVIPEMMRDRAAISKSLPYVSKWLQFLPTPERAAYSVKPSVIPRKRNPSSLKDSIVDLYKHQPKTPKTSKNGKQRKYDTKLRTSHNENNFKQKLRRNTETIVTKISETVPQITPRNTQLENFSNLSPNFLLDELGDLNESVTSLTPSCREGFKKLFGTDNLCDIFNCEKVYNLNENHVKRLATALNINHDTLKKTIEIILSTADNAGILEEGVLRSESSVVGCSQSPPQRVFHSQRSQISK